ncbi:unnamed protein product, partial [Prorocentrum cordatum]
MHADIGDHEAIIDSGCSKGMVSKRRLENFKALLQQEYPELYVSEGPSNTKYRFVGGDPKTAEAVATVLVQHLNATTEFEVLNTGPEQTKATPFLLGKPQLNNLKAVIDFETDTMYSKTTGTTVQLKTSSAGHYLFPLMLPNSVAAVATEAHDCDFAPLTDATAFETVTVQEHPRAFAVFLPPRLGELRADLQTEAGLKRMHDKLAHPTVDQLMRRITPALLHEKCHRWQSVYGWLPRSVLTDNGGEYQTKEVETFLMHHATRHFWIPPHTPAFAGLVERRNGVLKMVFYKLAENFKTELISGTLTPTDVMFQACAAKNSLVRRCGFSSQFLAFGNNHFFDQIDECEPPQPEAFRTDAAVHAQA